MKSERGFRPVKRDKLIQELRHDSDRSRARLPEPARCPACHRVHDHFPAGCLRRGGSSFEEHRAEILARVRPCEELEFHDNKEDNLLRAAWRR